MENLQSIAIAIQYSYSEQLDQTGTNQELRDAAFGFTQKEFPSLDQTKLNSIADLVVGLYDVVE